MDHSWFTFEFLTLYEAFHSVVSSVSRGVDDVCWLFVHWVHLEYLRSDHCEKMLYYFVHWLMIQQHYLFLMMTRQFCLYILPSSQQHILHLLSCLHHLTVYLYAGDVFVVKKSSNHAWNLKIISYDFRCSQW